GCAVDADEERPATAEQVRDGERAVAGGARGHAVHGHEVGRAVADEADLLAVRTRAAGGQPGGAGKRAGLGLDGRAAATTVTRDDADQPRLAGAQRRAVGVGDGTAAVARPQVGDLAATGEADLRAGERDGQ